MLGNYFFTRILGRSEFARERWNLPVWFDDLIRQEPVCIKIQNVHDYLELNAKEQWNLKTDFPTILPPFPLLWMEYRSPQLNFITATRQEEFHEPGDVGILMHTLERENGTYFVACSSFILTVRGELAHEGNFTFDINKEGIMISEGIRFFPASEESAKGLEKRGDWTVHLNRLVPVFMALSFMHCKNVELSEERISRQLRREAQRKNEPLIIYKTLEINPFKKHLQSMTGTDENLTPMRLHICRGHFKVFKDHPLFGKYTGHYWWPMHTRGNRAFGEVKKNYEIKTSH